MCRPPCCPAWIVRPPMVNRAGANDTCPRWAMPWSTMWPPVRAMSNAWLIGRIPFGSGLGSAFGGNVSPPTASNTKSGPRPVPERPPASRRSDGPLHSSRTCSTSLSPSAFGSSVTVAPSFAARSRRARIGSIPTICVAPLIRAPCTIDRPSGPSPSTATSAPGNIWIRFIVAARPVPVVSASIASWAAGRSVKTGTQYSSGTVASSAVPPSPAIGNAGVPSGMVAVARWASARY